MRAMVLNAPKPTEESPLVLEKLPAPSPSDGQVLIRVSACGVCHTDLHIVEGELPLPKLPLIPGHQIVGAVAALGAGVGRFNVGERIGVPWLGSTCGVCDFCTRGLENLCESARLTGYHSDGGYAEYVVAPADFAYRLPDGYEDVQAAPLLCAGVIGYRALKISGIGPGGRLAMYGFGGSAHVAIQVARHWGCTVDVMTRNPAHRKHALDLGAAWTGGAEDAPPAKHDAAVVFAPAGGLVPVALSNLRRGGTVALAGIYMTPIPEMDYGGLLYHERSVKSVANSTRQDVIDLLEIAPKVPIRTDVQVFALEEANGALLAMKESRITGAGVLKMG
jgi:propanol-preferring alcohol dehydrogenase